MEYSTLFNTPSIVIAPNQVKQEILKKISLNKQLLPIRFFSKEEWIDKMFYAFDDASVAFLMNHYHISIDNAHMYLQNLYYVENKEYHLPKLDFLVKMKQELFQANVLIRDPNFMETCKNKQIFVIGYSQIDELFHRALTKVETITTVQYLGIPTFHERAFQVVEYDFLEQEVEGVAYKIAQLLESGVTLDQIKLCNVDQSYHYALKKIFAFYQIPLELPRECALYELKMGIAFYQSYQNNHDIRLSLAWIKEHFPLRNDFEIEIYNALVKVGNRLLQIKKLPKKDEPAFLLYYLKNTKVQSTLYDHAITTIDVGDTSIDQDTYVFFLGFNLSSCPRISKDENYLSDDVAQILHLPTTAVKNTNNKRTLMNWISQYPKLSLSYKLASTFDKYAPSLLIDEYQMKVIKEASYPSNKTYSPLYDKIKLAKKVDTFISYQSMDEELPLLYHTYKRDFPYRTYDHSFKEIPQFAATQVEGKTWILSYSKLDQFFRCPYRYFLNHVVYLNDFSASFTSFVGEVFHLGLSKLDPDCDLDQIIQEICDKDGYVLSSKERFLLEKLKKELQFVINHVLEFQKHSDFRIDATEQSFSIAYDETVTLKAVVDKIMTYQQSDGEVHYALLDYKTGTPNLDFRFIEQGMNLQLPLYHYFLMHSETYRNAHLAGYYFQPILPNEPNVHPKLSYEKQKQDRIKLQGYSTANEEILGHLDYTYAKSQFIKSLGLTKNGFSKNSKLLYETENEQMLKRVETALATAVHQIKNNEFPIHPVTIQDQWIGCDYCSFHDICYKSYKDAKVLVANKSEGGEEDEQSLD